MSNTGKQSPLGINVVSSFLQNTGLTINPVVTEYMGTSKSNAGYTFGKMINNTCLLKLVWAINDAYKRSNLGGPLEQGPCYTNDTYNALLQIGHVSEGIPALGNSISPEYTLTDPGNYWSQPNVPDGSPSAQTYTNAPANTGYALAGVNSGYGQTAKWRPWGSANTDNHSITQWGYFRLHALQAWNEFNYNAGGAGGDARTPFPLRPNPEYKEFLASFMQAMGFIEYANVGIYSFQSSKQFLDGTFSNMNDLMTGDILGVSLSTKSFGSDLMALGKSLDLSTISSFGLPSNLLRTLYKNNVMTSELVLALLAAGISQSEIIEISSGEIKTLLPDKEKLIYGAFLIIIDENLRTILAGLNCSTPNLTNLADLLNVRKMFPSSYSSLTVPLYNTTTGPTNAKTYYLIFTNNGANPLLTSDAVREKVGVLIPPGQPLAQDSTVANSLRVGITNIGVNNTNSIPILQLQQPIPGFDSYLVNILPNDLATTAGAFSYSMQQIRNLEKVDPQKFGQVVFSIEGNFNLPLTNGSNVPVNLALANQGQNLTALGTGPYGSYTCSDFFGSMSGLPYPHVDTYNAIKQMETRKLYNIYDQLYLSTQWQRADITVEQIVTTKTIQLYVPAVPATLTTPGVPAIPNITEWYYNCVYTQTEDGGGYGRGSAPAPIVYLSPNNVEASIIARFKGTSLGSAGEGEYGRIRFQINNGTTYKFGTTVQFTNSPTSPTMPVETVLVEGPPIEKLPVTDAGIATNGVNVVNANNYWPSTMNSVCLAYITQANEEIQSIYRKNPANAKWLNINYNIYGLMLKTEQRSRFYGIPAVPIVDNTKKDVFLNTFPTTVINFVDTLPTYSQNTLPHMQAQTLEAIMDLTTAGGQSALAMMRQERNQTRLQQIGIDLDNNLAGSLPEVSIPDYQKLLLNGTAPIAKTGSGVFVEDCKTTWCVPSWPSANSNIAGITGNTSTANITPVASYVYDPRQGGLIIGTGNGSPGTNKTFTNGDCEIKVILPHVPQAPFVDPKTLILNLSNVGNTDSNIISNVYNYSSNISNTTVGNANIGNLTIDLTTGNRIVVDSTIISNLTLIVANNISNNFPNSNVVSNVVSNVGNISPNGNITTELVENGGTIISVFPTANGYLGNTTLIVPTLLDLTFVSSTLYRSAPNVDDAIAQVIECNCDCWVT